MLNLARVMQGRTSTDVPVLLLLRLDVILTHGFLWYTVVKAKVICNTDPFIRIVFS